MHINIGATQIEYSKRKKFLGVHIDSKLSFVKNINTMYGEARTKVSALNRGFPSLIISFFEDHVVRKNSYT